MATRKLDNHRSELEGRGMIEVTREGYWTFVQRFA
jgi:hypothetical protein